MLLGELLSLLFALGCPVLCVLLANDSLLLLPRTVLVPGACAFPPGPLLVVLISSDYHRPVFVLCPLLHVLLLLSLCSAAPLHQFYTLLCAIRICEIASARHSLAERAPHQPPQIPIGPFGNQRAIVSNLEILGFSKNRFFRKFKIELGVFGDVREVRTGGTVHPGQFSADLVVYGAGKSTFQHFPPN